MIEKMSSTKSTHCTALKLRNMESDRQGKGRCLQLAGNVRCVSDLAPKSAAVITYIFHSQRSASKAATTFLKVRAEADR